jgi:hypothetical protein
MVMEDRKLLFIGTYVDTLYVFSLYDFKKIGQVRSHESILSIVAMKDKKTICLGQANGFVDFITVEDKEGSISLKNLEFS